MPFVEGGIVVDAEQPQQQAAPQAARGGFVPGGITVDAEPQQQSQGGFVKGGITADPTPDDSYNMVLQYESAQTDSVPSKQQYLDYLKVKKEKPIPLKGMAEAFVPGLVDIASLPYKLGTFIGDIYQPPEGETEIGYGTAAKVAGGTAAEVAAQAKLKGQTMAREFSGYILDKLDQVALLGRSKEDRAAFKDTIEEVGYRSFVENADLKRQLARANFPEGQRVPAAQDVLQAFNVPQESISQPGLEVGGFATDPSSIAFAGGGKLASALAQRVVPLIPQAGQMLQRTGERISNLGRGPENIAGRFTTKVTGSEQMGQAVQEGVARGATTISVGEAAGLPITVNVPGLGTAANVISGTKGLGAAMETVGEAGAVSGGQSLTPTQRGLLGAGERVAAAEGASPRARALGTALARSGLETPVKLAADILIPMAGGAAGGGLLAVMTNEESDAIAAAMGSGAAFGAFDAGFKIAKAVESNVFNGARVRQTAVDDLNTRPTDVQFTYIDRTGEQTATIKDSEARATLYGRLNNKQLTKALSEVAAAEGAGVDVIFHSDSDTVPAGLQTVNYAGAAIGPKDIKSGRPTILINVDKAIPETIPHEILHARITQEIVNQLGSQVINAAVETPQGPSEFKKQFVDFAEKYAKQIEKSGGKILSDEILTELRDAFDPTLQRAQNIKAIGRITDEFAAYYTQEMLKGKDPKTMLPGRIPSFIEMALNNAKEAVSERFTRRALQAGFDPVARTFYDANGRRIKLDWMEDAIKNLVTPKEGYEPTEQRVDINKMTQAQQNAVIMARGYSDLFMTAPDGSIVRPLSKAEIAARTADIANRTMRVVESVPQAERTSISGMDAYGNPVIEGRLSLAEADAVSKSGIFGPSSSRTLIDIATAIRDGTLMEGNYWKVYGSTGRSGVFGESQKLFLPYGISINSKGGVNVKVVDWGKVQARMYKALSKPAYKSLFNNYDQAMSTMRDVYLKNIAETGAVPSAEALGGGINGAKKRNMFNEIMGAVPKKGDVMVNFPTAGYVANRKGGSVYQDLRLERIQNADSTKAQIPWTGDMGEQSSYRRTQLNFMPAEAIGETRVSTDENGGYRILSKNGKFRLYGPDGSTVGIFDTQEQAKLKAEKDYATQERLQPEVRQQQRPAGDEGRQATEAGGRNRAVGGQEGQGEGGAVRQADDVRFMPEEEPGEGQALRVGKQFTPEERKAISIANKKSLETFQRFPEAKRLEIQKDRQGNPKFKKMLDENENPVLGANGKPIMEVAFSKAPYKLTKSPKLSKKEPRAIVQAADLLETDARKAFNNPSISKGIGWYSTMRNFLQNQFGANIEVFGQLLGATSARTPVDTNFKQALEAIKLLSTGQYDGLLADFSKHVEKTYADSKSGELLKQWQEKNPNKKLSAFKTDDQIRKQINQFKGVPLRSNGRKYNANSQKVLHVLHGIWLQQTVGPKTPNFAGNLTGRTLKATIDVWAARNLRRLLYEGSLEKWRILPEQESGVTNKDFFFAQKVYEDVGKRLGMNADDLQALMWFMEKDVWEKNGWTSTVGAEKSSFDKEAGKLALDRYQAGVTTFTSADKYSPEVQEQERLALRKSISNIPGITSSRVNHSDGLYGNTPEPSLDVEFVVQRNKDGSSQDISAQVSEILRIANEQGRKQMDVFVSKMVDAKHPNARPMVEIGFKKPASKKDVKAVVDAFRSNGIDGFTMAKDGRGNVIGIRSQYIPEISARFDTVEHIDEAKFLDFASNWIDNVNKSLSEVEKIENVSYKNTGSVSTTVYGIEEYATAKTKDIGGTVRSEELGRRRRVLDSGQVSDGSSPVEGMDPGAGGLPAPAGDVQPAGSQSSEGVSGEQRFMPAGDREVTRAVNINDFSQDFTGQILNGQKTIETRDTLNNAMQGVLGQRIGLVRTGIKDTKVVGYATVAKQPIVYRDEAEFRRDEESHLVAPGSPYDIKKGGVKYGYELTDVVPVEPFAPKSVGRMYSVIEPKRYMPASDTDYLSAVKKGDTATAQRMVDEVANAAGYTVGPVYHRTSAKNINVFRPWVNFGTEEQSSNVDLTGRGEGDTRTYQAYLNLSNPIRVRDEGMAASNVLQQAREQGVVSGQEMASFPYNRGDDVERAYVAKVLEKNGFDGIVYENEYEGQGDSYIALKPSQIKSADPITKDNAGNVIPLSQRFKATSDDIRYMPETIQRDVGRNQDFANPPTDTEAVDALSSEKKAKFGAARSIKPGTQVAARIDIPAFLRTGKYVVAVHEPDGAAGGPGKVIGYDTVTRLQNPKFVVKPGVQRIYEGKSAKFPVATVDGKIMADRSIPADLENYVAVGMDPKEHAFFYDKRTDQPVIGGSEAVSVGNTVFVKNPVYGKPEDFRYMPSPDSAMPGAYSFPGGYRALPGKAKGSLRLYGPAGSLIGIASSLDEAQRILRRKNK